MEKEMKEISAQELKTSFNVLSDDSWSDVKL
jgi:hypothetical protein